MTTSYDVRDALRRESTEVPNDVGGRFRVLSVVPELGYRLPHDVSLRVRVPLHWKLFEESALRLRTEKNGLGDVELLAGYELRPASTVRAVAHLGVALPTGATERQPFVGSPGVQTPLQLGGGTLDPLLALTADLRPSDGWGLGATAAARWVVMDNAHGYRPATLLEASLGAQLRLWPRWLVGALALVYGHATPSAIDGVEAPNTGRDAVYLEPGVDVHPASWLTVGGTVRLPLYLRVRATQFTETVLYGVRIAVVTPSLD